MMALWFWRDLSRKVDTIRTLYENVPQSPAIDILAALRASLAEMKAEKPMKKERQP
jgi:hypothetical protein